MGQPMPQFPPPESADETGLVAVTDDMTPEMLLAGYQQGVFPWTDNPVCWYSPDPRAVFLFEHVHLPSNLRKIARRQRFVVTYDQAFTAVMRACAAAHAAEGVWITERFIRTYSALHRQGHAHSVEVWQDGVLVGGVYGVQTGRLFAGESMFYRVASASKVAFMYLIERLQALGILLLDAQVINEHTEALGAILVRRDEYLRALRHVVQQHTGYDAMAWESGPAPLR